MVVTEPVVILIQWLEQMEATVHEPEEAGEVEQTFTPGTLEEHLLAGRMEALVVSEIAPCLRQAVLAVMEVTLAAVAEAEAAVVPPWQRKALAALLALAVPASS